METYVKEEACASCGEHEASYDKRGQEEFCTNCGNVLWRPSADIQQKTGVEIKAIDIYFHARCMVCKQFGDFQKEMFTEEQLIKARGSIDHLEGCILANK